MNVRAAVRQQGATLIETVLVLVIVAIAATAIMDQFVTSADSYRINEALQTSAQLAQECAEHVLATRRLQGYAAALAATCPALPPAYAAAGYARTASPGAAPAACAGASCAQVDVIVTHDATERARVVFMLGSY